MAEARSRVVQAVNSGGSGQLAAGAAAAIQGASSGAAGAASPGSAGAVLNARSSGANITVRLADGSEGDYRAGVHLAQEAHGRTVFKDIPFSESKARQLFERATGDPARFGLIYAVRGNPRGSVEGAAGGLRPLAEDRLLGFASVQAGEYFLGSETLIATVQTLNVAQRLSGTFLYGKVALRLVQALRQWAKARDCKHLLVHVTNGVDAAEADRFFRRCGMTVVGGSYV